MNRFGQRQGGTALILLLFVLVLFISYSTYHQFTAPSANQAQKTLHIRLQRAKEALIARAVTDANRPGSLPCPDLITDDNGLSNHPGDGKADNLTRNDCPSYIGWLPWVTLDLPELTDHSGTRLWYVLARPLRDDDLAQPINSNISNLLSLDGQNDIAALIIAPGAALSGQSRPSNRLSDYLEDDNANGDSHFISSPAGEGFNDTVIALSKQELMSAVEKRVAGEVQACLEQHATALTNTWQEYPWPAPFTSNNLGGKSGSLFGRIPLSQPGSGPQEQTRTLRVNLDHTQLQLTTASETTAQRNALVSLGEQLSYTLAYFDQLYSTAKTLALLARSSNTLTTDFNGTLLAANSNGRISVTEKRTIQTDGGLLQNQLPSLLSTLGDSGFDVFPDELNLLNATLQTGIEQITRTPDSTHLAQLRDAANAVLRLLNATHTRNSELSQAITLSQELLQNSVNTSQLALASPGNSELLNAAVNSARSAKTADDQLQNVLAGNRLNLHPDEITARSTQLEAVLNAFNHSPARHSADLLAQALSETQSLIQRLATQSARLIPLRDSALVSLSAALTATTSSSDWMLMSQLSQQALAQTLSLGNAASQHADNLTRESLAFASDLLNSRQNTFNTTVTRTQAEMVPYAENLRLAAVDLQFWAEIISRQAGNLATLARKSPDASKSQINTSSAYTQTEQTLSSITDSTGSLKKLQDAIDNPQQSSKQSAAASALGTTRSLLDKMQQSLDGLQARLHSSTADAFPVLWLGSRCAFLQPGSDNTSWWLANQWSSTTFFQISQRTRSNTGQLQVNGRNGLHSVVISAGSALAGQNRQTSRSSSYFEHDNADSSRDGEARMPSPRFINRPTDAEFNDRLAF